MRLRHRCPLLAICLTAFVWFPARGKPANSGKPEPSPRTDLHGDPLPEGARARLGTVRFQTAGFPIALAVSPDGRTIACLGHGGAVTLLDMATGKQLRYLPGGEPAGGGLVFSPDGRRLATSDKKGITVWDVRTGQIGLRLRMDQDPCGLAFTRDGRAILATTKFGHVRQWDLATGKELWHFDAHSQSWDALALSPDGRWLARGGIEGVLQIWDLAARKPVPVSIRLGWADQIHQLFFSQDGKFLACGERKGDKYFICLRDAARGKEICRFGNFPMLVSLLVFSPSGKLVVTSHPGERSFRLWEVATGKEVQLLGQVDGRGCVAFTPDGKTLVTNYGTAVRLWDIAKGRRIPLAGGHSTWVSSLAFSPDGKLLASSSVGDDNRGVRLWDVSSARELAPFGDARGGTHAVRYSPNGKTLASARGSMVSLWDVASRKKLRVFGDREYRMDTPLAFAPDGKAILAFGTYGPRLWDPQTGEPIRTLELNTPATRMAMSFDGKFVATVYSLGNAIDIVDCQTGKSLRRLRPPLFPPGIVGETVLASSPTRPLLASANGKGLHLWDANSGKLLRRSALPEDWNYYRLAFSPDGRTLALTGGRGMIVLLEVATGKERCVFQAHETSIASLAFSPDGRLLASGGSDSTILLWDLARLPSANKR